MAMQVGTAEVITNERQGDQYGVWGDHERKTTGRALGLLDKCFVYSLLSS